MHLLALRKGLAKGESALGVTDMTKLLHIHTTSSVMNLSASREEINSLSMSPSCNIPGLETRALHSIERMLPKRVVRLCYRYQVLAPRPGQVRQLCARCRPRLKVLTPVGLKPVVQPL